MNSTIAIGVTLAMGLFYSWTGRINGIYFFGRTADQEQRASAEGRRITREYLAGIVLGTLAAAWLAWEGGHLGYRALSAMSLLAEGVAFSFLFARANGQVRQLTKHHASTGNPREAVIQVALLEQPTYWIPGLAAILLPVALCFCAFGIAVLRAGHGAGIRAGWAAFDDSLDGRGSAGVLGLASGMLAASVGLLLVFRISARLRTKMAQYTVRAMLSLEWIGAALLVVILACDSFGLAFSRGAGRSIILTAVIAALAAAIWNQARSKRYLPPPVEMGGDDRWRWGLFYVDRSDPALFVQSRCGAGYTLNYGRVAAWPISLGVIAYVIGVLFFLPRLK